LKLYIFKVVQIALYYNAIRDILGTGQEPLLQCQRQSILSWLGVTNLLSF